MRTNRGLQVTVVGGGLAGCEAAWQAAERAVPVTLYEMRPHTPTPAHTGGQLAELVCSNSLGSDLHDRAAGLLKAELRCLGSMLIACADSTRVPAGGALAVDRALFSSLVTQRVETHPLIQVVREEVCTIPAGHTIIATGPLTSASMAEAIAARTGREHLYFYDALAPIVARETIDMTVAFRASRYTEEEGDYINCPMTRDQYERLVDALIGANRIELRSFERDGESARFFEGCLPVEVLAERGKNALAFGPFRPTGLVDPRSGRRPYAVVQLRQDNTAGTLYNIVGFQTNLRYGEQKRVLSLIPGLERATIVRYGHMHRNTFLNSPTLLDATSALRGQSQLYFAGQITGIEGYVGSVGSGWAAGMNAARSILGLEPMVLPHTTMLGALLHYISHADAKAFQPMKANFGLLAPLDRAARSRRERRQAYAARALTDVRSMAMLSSLSSLST